MPVVFISHRGGDTLRAEKLAHEIRNRGHIVRLDSDEVTVGTDIVQWMNDAIGSAQYVIVCYSASGGSPWMDIEWSSALARQLEGHGIKVLPARLTGSTAPAILAGVKYADLVADWNRGVLELLAAIK